jgi:hypothetical protein
MARNHIRPRETLWKFFPALPDSAIEKPRRRVTAGLMETSAVHRVASAVLNSAAAGMSRQINCVGRCYKLANCGEISTPHAASSFSAKQKPPKVRKARRGNRAFLGGNAIRPFIGPLAFLIRPKIFERTDKINLSISPRAVRIG